MIATLYKLPTWIMEENKPSYNLFIELEQQALQEIISCETIEYPTLTTLNVRSSLTLNNWNIYNYININNLWYKIVDVSYISANNNVVNIDGEIDIYLSYVLKYFDVNNTNFYGQVVFFKQKHLNRWYYNTNNNKVINFEQQFYLKNKHQKLADLGKNPAKAADGAIEQWYNPNNNTPSYSSSTLTTFYGSGYIYALFNLTANESNQTFYNNMAVSGLVNVGNNIAYGSVNENSNIGYGLPWWYVLQYVGNAAYTDYIVLPMPIEYGYILNNALSFEQTINNASLNFTDNVCPDVITDSAWYGITNIIAWTVNPQNLYYFYNPNNQSNTQPQTLKPFNKIFNIEPYIFQYCNFRVRGAGEDSLVDLTYFNNVNPTSYINTLYSFCININHPTTQITNVLYNFLFFQVENVMYPYAYNSISDCFYCLNWKLIYPSLSNNWNNYMLTNLNQYHTALNIAHYGLQKSQADLGFDAMKAATGTISGFFDGGIGGAINGAINGAESLTNGTFNEMSQQQEYNYLKTGKKADMSRTSNARLATNNNAIAYNNFLVSFVFEYPPEYEQIIAINYCILNGYVVDKWLPFNFWYNRKVVNYVSCSYFADVMLPNMNLTYKKAIDKLFNDGFRVWCLNENIEYWGTLPTLAVLYGQNQYLNSEVNLNNNEINFLTEGINE